MCVTNLHVRGSQIQIKCDFKVSLYVYKRENGKFICRIHNYILAGTLLSHPSEIILRYTSDNTGPQNVI